MEILRFKDKVHDDTEHLFLIEKNKIIEYQQLYFNTDKNNNEQNELIKRSIMEYDSIWSIPKELTILEKNRFKKTYSIKYKEWGGGLIRKVYESIDNGPFFLSSKEILKKIWFYDKFGYPKDAYFMDSYYQYSTSTSKLNHAISYEYIYVKNYNLCLFAIKKLSVKRKYNLLNFFRKAFVVFWSLILDRGYNDFEMFHKPYLKVEKRDIQSKQGNKFDPLEKVKSEGFYESCDGHFDIIDNVKDNGCHELCFKHNTINFELNYYKNILIENGFDKHSVFTK